MSLQTIVKAGNINNLSDARYCAGMGVEIIGFPLEKSNPRALEISKIKEITGWLAGVKIALEFDDFNIEEAAFADLLVQLNPDYIQLSSQNVGKIKKITAIPLIIVTNTTEEEIEVKDEDYILFSGSVSKNMYELTNYCKKYNVLLSGNEIHADTVKSILEEVKPSGIELQGGTEISPGLKSFDEFSDILELLEVE